MAGVVIPPWLDVKPESFVQASEAGARTGAELRGQDLEHQARMSAIAQQGSDAQLHAQEMSERNQIAREVAKNRIAIQTANAANIFQQQQQRQRAIDGGMDPIQAWLQFPGTTSGSPGAGAFNALNQSRRASLPLEPVEDPNQPGRVAGFHDGNKFYALPQAKPAASKIDPMDMIAIKHLQGQLSSAQKAYDAEPSISPRKGELAKNALQYQRALQKFGVNFDGPSGGAAKGPAAAGGPPGLPTKGQVINGHTFLGGDPADKNSWQELGSEGSSFIGTPGEPNEAALPGDMQDNQPVPTETDEEQ